MAYAANTNPNRLTCEGDKGRHVWLDVSPVTFSSMTDRVDVDVDVNLNINVNVCANFYGPQFTAYTYAPFATIITTCTYGTAAREGNKIRLL